MLFSNWWEDLDRPHRIADQYFGMPPSELLRSAIAPPESEIVVFRPSRRHSLNYHPYERRLASRRSSGVSTVQPDKDKFQVSLDVQQFSPEEVTVKVVGRNVVIEGNHEEKQDEHGWISRRFVRKYLVPEQCDIDKIKSNLSSDGVLSIEAPRKDSKNDSNERVIPIHNTGMPAVADTASTSGTKSDHKDQNSQKVPARAQEKNSKTVKAA